MLRTRTSGRLLRRPGVTLIELLVTVAVISVLAALTYYFFSAARRTADNIEAQVADAKKHLAKANGPVKKKATPTPRTTRPGFVPDEYIITFQDSVTEPATEAERIAAANNGTVKFQYRGVLHGFALTSPTATVADLAKDPAVKFVEQSQYVYKSQERSPTGIRRVRAAVSPRPLPWTLNFPPLDKVGGPGSGRRNIRVGVPPGVSYTPRAVAVIDSGIDNNHPELNVVFSRGFSQKDVGDGDGHGTHVAGTIGARGNGTGVVGVFPGVPLWALRVFDDNGGGGTVGNVIAAMDEAHFWADKLSVVNMSLGGGFSAALNNAVDKLVVRGLIVVVSAGNSSVDASTGSPSSAPRAICVASLSDSDGQPGGKGPATSGGADDTFGDYSNWGNVVAFVSPGTDIESTYPIAKGSYSVQTGTSMAAPHVSGMAAIVAELGRLQAAPGINIRNYIPQPLPPALTPDQVRGILFSMVSEQIPGRFDSRTYPLLAGRP